MVDAFFNQERAKKLCQYSCFGFEKELESLENFKTEESPRECYSHFSDLDSGQSVKNEILTLVLISFFAANWGRDSNSDSDQITVFQTWHHIQRSRQKIV